MDDTNEIVQVTQPAMTPDQIREAAKTVDPKALAKEIMAWLITNVEQYIDNNEQVFRLYLAVDSRENMPEAMKLQDLYVAIPTPEDDKDDAAAELEVELLEILDAICEEVHQAVAEDEAGLKELFKRLIYFYEMTGYSREVGPLVQKLDGSVKVNELAFDPVPMTMQVKQPVAVMKDGQMVETGEKRVVKEVTLPAGFGIELELEYWKNQPATSMY